MFANMRHGSACRAKHPHTNVMHGCVTSSYANPTDHRGDGTGRSRATIAVDVHHAMSLTYDYYASVHNYTNWNAKGMTAYAHMGGPSANIMFYSGSTVRPGNGCACLLRRMRRLRRCGGAACIAVA